MEGRGLRGAGAGAGARPPAAGSEDKGRTRQIQTGEVAGARRGLGRGAHWMEGRLLRAALEHARPNPRG